MSRKERRNNKEINRLLWATFKFGVLHYEWTYETQLERQRLIKALHRERVLTYDSPKEMLISALPLTFQEIKERLGL